jgi:hypothetical protein
VLFRVVPAGCVSVCHEGQGPLLVLPRRYKYVPGFFTTARWKKAFVKLKEPFTRED